jgi:uncharacterized protein
MQLPETIAVMPSDEVVFFPHMLLPLHIYEPRYRQMLEFSLQGSRMFAISNVQAANGCPHTVGTVGLIRACVKKADGTSNLLLQGLYRTRFTKYLSTSSYHISKNEPLHPRQPANPQVAGQLVEEILYVVSHTPTLCPCHQLQQELVNQVGNPPTDYNTLIDILGGSLVSCPQQRQQILECEDTTTRLSLLATSLRTEYSQHGKI